jgi:hypothetical protein
VIPDPIDYILAATALGCIAIAYLFHESRWWK